ncbi:putative trafficking protein particle complex subunit 8 [Paratrimastix pyriformis]|uniref:Trafficking protein particle complex subunit 8 n=1 Tax=Paratrimastix pyriformis TaxID=342808 RepID=A0ABQ8UJE2_9EUKA|nr:putative trafficking protein particle complex subunit 8 [Paratrimastix pyriformis]
MQLSSAAKRLLLLALVAFCGVFVFFFIQPSSKQCNCTKPAACQCPALETPPPTPIPSCPSCPSCPPPLTCPSLPECPACPTCPTCEVCPPPVVCPPLPVCPTCPVPTTGNLPVFTFPLDVKCVRTLRDLTEAEMNILTRLDRENAMKNPNLVLAAVCLQQPLDGSEPRDALNILMHKYVENGNEEIFEEQWLIDMFARSLGRTVFIFHDHTRKMVLSNSLILAHLVPGFGEWNLLAKAKSEGKTNLGIYHMADETFKYSINEVYEGADYILRNYFRPELMESEEYRDILHWIPNGWRNNFGPIDRNTIIPTSKRSNNCFWSGSLRGDRQQMANIIADKDLNCEIVVTGGFGQGLGTQEYRAKMANTKWCLNPHGNSPETIRFYEIVESGCLLINMHHPNLELAYGPNGILTVDKWTELPHLFQRLESLPPERLDLLQKQQYEMWDALKREAFGKSRQVEEALLEPGASVPMMQRPVQELIINEFLPTIMLISTKAAEDVCEKNNLSVLELLQPFTSLPYRVELHTVDEVTYRLEDYHFRLVPFRNILPSPEQIAETTLSQLVHSTQADPGLERAGYLRNPAQVQRYLNGLHIDWDYPLPTPWFDKYFAQLLQGLRGSEHETISHPVAYLLVASTAEPNLVPLFRSLFDSAALPEPFASGLMDSLIDRYCLLLHDASARLAPADANPEMKLSQVRQHFEFSKCKLVTLNSRDLTLPFPPAAPAPAPAVYIPPPPVPAGVGPTPAPLSGTPSSAGTPPARPASTLGGVLSPPEVLTPAEMLPAGSPPPPPAGSTPSESPGLGARTVTALDPLSGLSGPPATRPACSLACPSWCDGLAPSCRHSQHIPSHSLAPCRCVSPPNPSPEPPIDPLSVPSAFPTPVSTPAPGPSALAAPSTPPAADPLAGPARPGASRAHVAPAHGPSAHPPRVPYPRIPPGTIPPGTNAHGQLLTPGNVQQLQEMVADLATLSAQSIQVRMRSLKQSIDARRKKGGFFAQWNRDRRPGSESASPPSADPQRILAGSYEFQLRRLADLCFVVRDYQGALRYAQLVAAELKGRAWAHYAAAQARDGLPIVLPDRPGTECPCGLILARMLMHRGLGQAIEALSKVGLANETSPTDSNLRTALIHEQIGQLFLRLPVPRRRKYAYFVVLAAHHYARAGQREHCMRCYRTGQAIYGGLEWALVDNYLDHSLGRYADALGMGEVDQPPTAITPLPHPTAKRRYAVGLPHRVTPPPIAGCRVMT